MQSPPTISTKLPGVYYIYMMCLAKATSCRAAIRTARGVVADLGEEVASGSGGLPRLASISEKNSERDFHRLTGSNQYKLSLPIDLGTLPRSKGVSYTGDMNVIPLRNWLKFLVTFNCWHVMVGLLRPDPPREAAILTEWWARFRALKPTHQIWTEIAKYHIDVSRTVPLLLHGDEGRGRKRGPFLVAAYHSMLGRGTLAANAERKKKRYITMKLNYSGNAFTHRMLSGCLPKMLKDEVALQDLLQFLTNDSMDCLRNGFTDATGTKYHFATIQVIGDWAWLVKAGNLSRSYSAVEKRPRSENAAPRGICHLCRAGQLDVPFEDLSRDPIWRSTMFEAGDFPFVSRPKLLGLPHEPGREGGLFCFDLWHGMHLGFGKTFLGAVLALISQRMPGGNVEKRFEQLSELYLEFCEETHTTAYLTAITKDTLQWPDQGTYPNGVWSKGHVTTTLLKFVSFWFERNDTSDDVLLTISKGAAYKINECLNLMYTNDLWLDKNTAKHIAGLGLDFCERYMECANESFQQGKALYIFMPKAHLCHHVFLELAETAQRCQWSLNPLSTAVQVDEDFVGKTCRLSRRVSPQQSVKRVLQRFLEAAFRHWSEEGYIRTV